MIMLSLFAFSVVFRSRLATKIESYETKRFERTYDFLSAVNLSRFFIESDTAPAIDSESDHWYHSPKEFSKMNFSKRFELEITDEESKINLNQASEPFLIAFFEVLNKSGLKLQTQPRNLVASILAWRGQGASQGISLGYKQKRAPFETVGELRLIQFMTPHDFEVLKPFMTVYSLSLPSQMKVNINTVQPYILEALIKSLSGDDYAKRELFKKIINFRKEKQSFLEQDFNSDAFIQKLELNHSPTMAALLNQFFAFLTVDSQFFSVHVRSLIPKRTSFVLDTVLGPRIFRSTLGLTPSATLTQSGGAVKSLPLEILFWQERTI